MTWQPSAPARRYDYVTDGPAIYVDSFATIRREADLSSVPASAERLAVRMVHGSGQVDLVPDLVIHPEAVPAAREALEAGAPVLCDARMVAVGAPAADRQRALLDRQAPDAALLDLQGAQRSLSEWSGRRRLLVVFASW